jgi:hypothetical protein
MKDDFYKYKMNIDVRSTDCVYITINGWTYFIDDSTNEQIFEKFKEREQEEK